jgi:hypothetical protein
MLHDIVAERAGQVDSDGLILVPHADSGVEARRHLGEGVACGQLRERAASAGERLTEQLAIACEEGTPDRHVNAAADHVARCG